MSKKNLLTDLRIDEISLVDRGANSEALVKIWKRDDSVKGKGKSKRPLTARDVEDEEDEEGFKAAKKFADAIKKAFTLIPDLEPEVIAKMEEAVDEAQAALLTPAPDPEPEIEEMPAEELAELKTENEELKKRLAALEDGNVKKADYESVVKRLEESETQLADFAKRDRIGSVAKRLTDAGMASGEAATQAEVIDRVAKVDLEAAKSMEESITKAVRIAKHQELFQERGMPSHGADSMSARVDALVRDTVAKGEVTDHAAAYDRVVKGLSPDDRAKLYAEG